MSKGIVLAYHRVIDISSDPQVLAVSPKIFLEQMKYLKSRFQILPLHDLADRLSGNIPLNGCISITFDDGYADNLHYALPVLEELDIPVTFFVTIGMVGSDKEFGGMSRKFILFCG